MQIQVHIYICIPLSWIVALAKPSHWHPQNGEPSHRIRNTVVGQIPEVNKPHLWYRILSINHMFLSFISQCNSWLLLIVLIILWWELTPPPKMLARGKWRFSSGTPEASKCNVIRVVTSQQEWGCIPSFIIMVPYRNQRICGNLTSRFAVITTLVVQLEGASRIPSGSRKKLHRFFAKMPHPQN